MGTGVSVLSALKKGMQGWIRTASTRRTVRRVKKPLRGFFRCAARVIHPRPPRTPVSNGYRSFCFICLEKGDARVDSNSIDPPNSPAGKKAPVQQQRPLPAAETGRSCWGCGQQDARAAQGTMQPLGAATRVPFLRGSRNLPAPTKNRNVSKYAAVFICNSDIFTSPACQSSCARILFCTISPAGVRARVRPSKVAYPARTQFCTKASCAVENCLPYRVL